MGFFNRLIFNRLSGNAFILAFCVAAATCCGCAPPQAPAGRQKRPPPRAVLSADTTPIRPTSFTESPALQHLADAGAWITLKTTFLPATNRGTLIRFEGQTVSVEMLVGVSELSGDVFLDFKDCRFDKGALTPLDGLENVHALTLGDETTHDAVLQGVSNLPNLEMFIATSPFITSEGLDLVDGAKHIHYLSLADVKLGDIGVTSPAEHQNLIELNLWGASITNEGLRSVAALPVLMRLELTNCGVGDAGVAHLGSLKELRSLDLNGTKVTDEGLAGLQTLKKLESLNLTRTAIRGPGLARLADLSNLETLDLSSTLIDDESLQVVLKLRSLRSVVLRNNAVTDAGVVTLAALPKLDSLDVLGTEVSDAVRGAFAPTVTLSIGKEPESAKDPGAR